MAKAKSQTFLVDKPKVKTSTTTLQHEIFGQLYDERRCPNCDSQDLYGRYREEMQSDDGVKLIAVVQCRKCHEKFALEYRRWRRY